MWLLSWMSIVELSLARTACSRFAFMVLHKYPPDLSDSYHKMGSPTFSMQSDTFEFFMILVFKLGNSFLVLVSHSSSLP